MIDCEKINAYHNLVEKVQQSYLSSSNELHWCQECHEINLWTYWQGRGHYDAKIMVVGQDWGDPHACEAQNVIENIRKMNNGEDASYMAGNPSLTDTNLIRLFDSIGYDLYEQQPELFFTNFVLGYRTGNISKNYRSAWAAHDTEYFAELVRIIRPQSIICLGKVTFLNVLKSLQIRHPKIKKYNDYIQSENNPVQYLIDDKLIHIFAMAHCGALGTMNRNRGNHEIIEPLELQKKDWRKIKDL